MAGATGPVRYGAQRLVLATGVGRTMLAGQLGAGPFEEAIGACRLLLLPYHPGRYVGRISGLFAEAAAWGRPVVAAAGTWMGEMVTAGRAAGVLFERYTGADVGKALVAALEALDTLGARALEVAPAWRASEHIERALDEILAWAVSP